MVNRSKLVLVRGYCKSSAREIFQVALFRSLFLIFTGTILKTAFLDSPTIAGEGEDLAKKLSNPIASLISVPVQGNYDWDIGPIDDGERLTINVQPVIPFSLNEDWNLISRTIVPIISQNDLFPGSGDQFGIGDVVQSLFFFPSQPTARGIIWGVGPVILLPTGTDKLLSAKKLGMGPTAVALKQIGPWTIGGLVNHIWSVAGKSSRPNISTTFLQPFLSYTTPNAWTFSANTESSYNWKTEDWSVPINVQIAKLIQVGAQPVSVFGGVRYWADSSTDGPEGFGVRFGFTLLFPK